MPFFKGRRKDDVQSNGVDEALQHQRANNGYHHTSKENIPSRPKLVFHCQQAQGSPTGIISGFTNVMELYQKIAECYDIPSADRCGSVSKGFWASSRRTPRSPGEGDRNLRLRVRGGIFAIAFSAFSSQDALQLYSMHVVKLQKAADLISPLEVENHSTTSLIYILFCTLNTHKVDMSRLLGGQIGLDDFIFAHRKGRPKEIEIHKTEDALGLTITDNGAGYAFIKRIKENSVIDKIKHIEVGDHIEKIDEVSLIGKRHFEVAKMLKDIPKGTLFNMRVVEPLKAGFANIGPRSDPRASTKKSYGSGKQTLRFKANGNAEVEDAPDDIATFAAEKINGLLENFLGINDNDLATQIWDLSHGKQNTMEFAEAVDASDLEIFGFTDDFLFELWGIITDAKAGRLVPK